MMVWVLLLIFVVSNSAADGQAIKMDFSSGTCYSGVCEVQNGCGMDGGSCLVLKSNSSLFTLFRSASIPEIAAGSKWIMAAYVKCFKQSTTAVYPFLACGDTTMNAASQIKTFTTSNGWSKYEFISSVSSAIQAGKMTVGVENKNGYCYFDGVSSSPIQIKEFSYENFGPLGHQETIFENGTYSSHFGDFSFFGSYFRNVVQSTASWDGTHFRFMDKTFVVFNHSLKTTFLTSPTVMLSLYYHTGGNLTVQSSIDGNVWITLGFMASVSTSTFTLPSTSHKLIKLTSYGGANYINYYNFRSTVITPANGKIVGNEILIAIDSKSTNSNANISISLGSDYPSHQSTFNTTIPVYLTSSSTSSISMKLNVIPDLSTSIVAFSSNSLSISPLGSSSTNFIYHLSGGKKQEARFSMVSIVDSSSILAGRFLFWPMHFFLDDSYGYLLQTTSSASLWFCDGVHQIYKYRSAPTTISSKITVSAARNEKEPFQLVIRSKTSPVTINSFSITDLTGPNGKKISKTTISIRRVFYSLTKFVREYNKYALPGSEWPDALVPLDLPYICKSNTNCPFWVLLSVGPNVTEGDYSGTISISTPTGSLSSALSLHVWNITIPTYSRLPSEFGIPHDLWKYHNLSSSSSNLRENQWNLYLKSFEEHRMSPNSAVYFHSPSATVVSQNGTEHWKYNFADFENSVPKYFNKRFYGYKGTLYGLPSGNSITWNEGKITGVYGTYLWGSENHTKLFTEYAQHYQDLLERTGMLDQTILYPFDEPSEADFDKLKEVYTKIHQVAPKLKILLTVPVLETFLDYVDVWCWPWSSFNATAAKLRQEKGDIVWIYKAITMQTDDSITEARIWLWQIFKYNIQGFLYWSVDWWTSAIAYNNTLQDPYEDAMAWGRYSPLYYWGNGEGRLLYPPVNWKSAKEPIYNSTPVETMRWENLRDGLEDWEMLTTLRDLLNSRPNLPANIRSEANLVLEIPDDMVAETSWMLEPDMIFDKREKVANLIETIQITEDIIPSANQNSGESQTNSAPTLNSFVPFIVIFVITTLGWF